MNLRGWFVTSIFVFWFVFVVGAATVSGHDTSQIEAFEVEWARTITQVAEDTAPTGGVSVSDLTGLLAAQADFVSRHGWYYNPEPSPRTVSTVPTVPADVEQWRQLIAAFFPASEVDRALCVVWFESRGVPDAVNPTSTATGLFQILAFWEAEYGLDRFDPVENVELARIVWGIQGWGAWSVFNRGLC